MPDIVFFPGSVDVKTFNLSNIIKDAEDFANQKRQSR